MSNLLQSESKVVGCTLLFIKQMQKWADRGRPVALGAWLQYYAFDVVGELAFGKKLGFLESGEDVDGMMHAIEDMLAHAALCGQVPEAHHILLGNPILTRFAPAMETQNQILIFALKAINSRVKLRRDEEITNGEEEKEEDVDMLCRWSTT